MSWHSWNKRKTVRNLTREHHQIHNFPSNAIVRQQRREDENYRFSAPNSSLRPCFLLRFFTPPLNCYVRHNNDRQRIILSTERLKWLNISSSREKPSMSCCANCFEHSCLCFVFYNRCSFDADFQFRQISGGLGAPTEKTKIESSSRAERMKNWIIIGAASEIVKFPSTQNIVSAIWFNHVALIEEKTREKNTHLCWVWALCLLFENVKISIKAIEFMENKRSLSSDTHSTSQPKAFRWLSIKHKRGLIKYSIYVTWKVTNLN